MAKPAKKKTKQSQMPASVCWFDIPADDMGRAKKFYSSLFGWKFAKLSAAVADYWHIDTGGKDATPDGGLLPRIHPGHSITVYVTVPSVDKAMAKVQKLGGTVCNRRPLCRIWAISRFVRTRSTILSRSGR
jgi:predicted enzyme related to lactoylglutathione lyase